MTALAKHGAVYELENFILANCPPVEMKTEHSFCDGLYARTMHIAAGTVLTGAVHAHECFFVVRSGVIIVTTGDNDSITLCAGAMLIAPAGTKRAGVALHDSVVTTFHANPRNLRESSDLWCAFTKSGEAIK